MRDLTRPVLAIPETKDVGALLRDLRERREQLAVVLDECGSVAGIVTLEDILEELVGEIQDEFDLPDARLTRFDDRTVRPQRRSRLTTSTRSWAHGCVSSEPGPWRGWCSTHSHDDPTPTTAS